MSAEDVVKEAAEQIERWAGRAVHAEAQVVDLTVALGRIAGLLVDAQAVWYSDRTAARQLVERALVVANGPGEETGPTRTVGGRTVEAPRTGLPDDWADR